MTCMNEPAAKAGVGAIPRKILAIFGFVMVSAMLLQAPASARADTITVEELNSQLQAGYRVAAGDKLSITVFDEPALTGEYQIGVDGALSMPLIDELPSIGLSAEQIETNVANSLKDGGYVLVPRVSVEIIAHRPFYILGEVREPGEYPYNGNLTFEQSVALAGGFTPRANRKTIMIRREGWTEERRVRMDGQVLKIAPGDTIRIKESFF